MADEGCAQRSGCVGDRRNAISYAEEQLTRTGKGMRGAVTVMAASDTMKSGAAEAGAPGRRGPPATDTTIVVQKNTLNGGGGGVRSHRW